MGTRARAILAGTAIAAALGAPGAVQGSPSAKAQASKQAVAVAVCVDYRRQVGHDAFRELFGSLRGCVDRVVTPG